MSLHQSLRDDELRTLVAADAIAEAHQAVRERSGLGAMSAQLGLETINRLRPGFLERHVHAMLPDLALAIEPHWNAGVRSGDPHGHLGASASEVTQALLGVADAYVATASDTIAIAAYDHLRPRAQQRIEEQMPRIASFIERHTPPELRS